MIATTLDSITRRNLLESGCPIHFYPERLFHSATCLRELSFDSLQLINSANLPVDETGNIVTPADFVDDISVCIPAGQSLQALPKQDWITPLRIHNSQTGQYTSYGEEAANPLNVFFGYPIGAWTWFFNVDSFGSPTGRFFGAKGGTTSGYQVFKQQRRIQMSEDFIGTNVVVIYISDGQSVDAATQIDPQAFATIDAFINWKISPNRDNDNSPEGRRFYNQRRLLRARLNPLTCTDIRNILSSAYTATIKN